MAIRVNSGGTVGATALGSAAAGQARDRRRTSLINAQATQQRNEAERNRDFALVRDQQNFENTLVRDQQQNQFRADQQQRSFDNIFQRDETNFDNSLIRDDLNSQRRLEDNLSLNEQRNELNRGNFSFELSERQRQDFNQLADVYERAEESGDYTPEELQDLRRQIDARRLGIRPQQRAQKSSPFPQGQNTGDVWQSNDGQYLLTRDQNGNVKKVADTGRLSPRDQFEARQKAYELAIQQAGENGGNVDEAADRIFKRLMGQNGQSGQISDLSGSQFAERKFEILDKTKNFEMRKLVPPGTTGALSEMYRDIRVLKSQGKDDEAKKLLKEITAFTDEIEGALKYQEKIGR